MLPTQFRFLILKLIAITLVCTAGWLSAEPDAPPPVSKPEWRLSLGVDAGLSLLSTSVANEGGKKGFSGNGKFLFGYYQESWAIDAAVGGFYNHLGRGDNIGTLYTIDSFALLTELGARFRILPRWYLGPVVSLIAGGDLSFQESANPQVTPSPTQSVILLAGLQALYEIPDSQLRMRAGLRASTDININNRQLFLIQGVFQIGLPLLEMGEVAEEPKAKPVVMAPAAEEKLPKVITDIDLGKISFETGSAKLAEDSKAYLLSVGKVLSTQRPVWHELQVQGHTDKTGPMKLNMRLSQARADAVKAALVAGGAESSRISAQGFGPTLPLDKSDSEAANSKNRRVEFKFKGLNHPEELEREVSQIRESYPPE